MISFIVPCLNSEQFLKDCLHSIKDQNISSEIIVVDCESKDRTLEIAQKFANVVITCPQRNVSMARNLGLEAAQYKWVALVDSDVILEPNWAEENLVALNSGPFQISQAPVIPDGPSSFLTTYRRLLSKITTKGKFIHLDNFAPPRITVNTAACLLDLNSFPEISFDENLLKIEDADFMTQLYFLGANFTCTEKTQAKVSSNLDLLSYLKRSFKQGINSAYFNTKWNIKKGNFSLFIKPVSHESIAIKVYHYLVSLAYHLGYYFSARAPKSQNIKPTKRKDKIIFNHKGDQTILSPFTRVICTTKGYFLIDSINSRSRCINQARFKKAQPGIWELISLDSNESTRV